MFRICNGRFSALNAAFTMLALTASALDVSHQPWRHNVARQRLVRREISFSELGAQEEDFNEIVSRRSDSDMVAFAMQLVQLLGGRINDEGKLMGVVPYYSGTTASQSFWRFLKEMQNVSNSKSTEEPWVSLPPYASLVQMAKWGSEYDTIVEGKSEEGMVRLVHKVLSEFGGGVLDERALIGFVPFYCGTSSTQAFNKMVKELLSLSRKDDPWVHLPFHVMHTKDLVAQLQERKLAFWRRKQVNTGIHDVVGESGVLQIVLERSSTERADVSQQVLASAGIQATRFSATDVNTATQDQLKDSCPLNSQEGTAEWCTANGKVGPGCLDTVAQAITDSHRRALIKASQRTSSNWTMIIEDDVVPVHPEDWAANFRLAWQRVPPEVGMVRLARCVFEHDLGPVRKRNTTLFAGGFQLVDWPYWTDSEPKQRYYTGGCTTGYMVHKSVIPELLGLFPCCCPIDCCFENQLFYSKGHEGAEFRGEEIMTNLDHWDTREYAKDFAGFMQEGVMVQDNREIKTSRPEWVDPRKVGGNWKATTREDGK